MTGVMLEVDFFDKLEADFLLSNLNEPSGEGPDLTIHRGGSLAVACEVDYDLPIVASENRRRGYEPAASHDIGRASVPRPVYRGEVPVVPGRDAPEPPVGGNDGGSVPPQEPPVGGGDALPDPGEEPDDEGRLSELWRNPSARHALWGPITLKGGVVVGEERGPDFVPPDAAPADALIYEQLDAEAYAARIVRAGERLGRFLRFQRGAQIGHEVYAVHNRLAAPQTPEQPEQSADIAAEPSAAHEDPVSSRIPDAGGILTPAEQAELLARRQRGDTAPDYSSGPEDDILKRLRAGLYRDDVGRGQQDPAEKQLIQGVSIEDVTVAEIAAAGGDIMAARAAKIAAAAANAAPETPDEDQPEEEA